jgi:ribosomal subunit interface protein
MTESRKPAPRRGAQLGERASAAAKAGRGATSTARTPLRVQGHGVVVSVALREHVASRLGALFGKFARRLTRVTVRFKDMSGPNGEPARSCAIRANVSGHGPVLVSVTARNANHAFDTAAVSIERTIRRLLERRQRKHRS